MTVHTTYFGGVGAAADPDPDDLVFGVVQFPKDFVDEIVDRNLPALAPPERLLSTFKTVEEAAERDGEENPSAVAWRSADVEERYLDHLQKSGPQQVFANVREHVRDRRDVWLVCWEKDVRYCHRRLLARELVDGLDVDVEHHPEPEQVEASEQAKQADRRDADLTDFSIKGGAQ